MSLFNTPTYTDKRLFLLSDTQSRVKVVGPDALTAFNITLIGPNSFSRTADDCMYVDPVTGLLVEPDANLPRFEVSGLLLEPDALYQWVRETENIGNVAVWTHLNSPVISSKTQVSPTGTGNDADVLLSK